MTKPSRRAASGRHRLATGSAKGELRMQPTIGTLGLTSILLIAALVVLFFGSSQIPKLFRSFGKLRNEYRKGQRDDPSGG